MTTSSAARRVVVIGAGIVGSFAAVRLAELGARVVLVGDSAAASTATRRSFAWVNAMDQVPEPYYALRTRSLALWRDLPADPLLGRYLARTGGLHWDLDDRPAELVQGGYWREPIPGTAARLAALGQRVELIDRARALELAPILRAASVPDDGVLWLPDDGWVETGGLLAELAARLLDLGGGIVRDGGASLLTAAHRASGVRLSDGTAIAADAVLVAAGAGTARLLNPLGVRLPDASNRGVLVTVAGPIAGLGRVVRNPQLTARPAAGGRIVLHSRAVDDAGGEAPTVRVDDRYVVRLVAQGVALLDERVGPLSVERIDAGRRPIPGGDGLSIVGQIPGVEDAWVAFTHSGVSLGPILGDVVARAIDGDADAALGTFSPARYA